MLLGNGPIVIKGLESLPVFTLKHHFQLLPAGLGGVSFFGIDVKVPQEVNGPGVNVFQSTDCWGEVKLNLGASQHGVVVCVAIVT